MWTRNDAFGWLRGVARVVLLAGALGSLAACVTQAIPGNRVNLDAKARVALLPLANATEVPQAQDRVGAIVGSLLRQKGLEDLVVYPQKLPDNPLEGAPVVTPEQALEWARKQDARYAITGTVTEWRYKTGVDNEPAAGVMLQLHELPSGRVIWSASGGRTGWGYQGLAAVGQAQIADLLSGMTVTAPPAKPQAKE